MSHVSVKAPRSLMIRSKTHALILGNKGAETQGPMLQDDHGK